MNRAKKNIMITGASGFIGKHLSKSLEDTYNIFSLDSRPNTSLNSNINNYVVFDLTDKARVSSYFNEFKKDHKIDIIIHLAFKLVSSGDSDNTDILFQNIKITESIVGMAKILKPKKIINFSSIAVYPNKNGTYSELSEIKPSVNVECLYGLSKFCSENILDFKLQNENILISHLRVAQVYGDGMRDDRIIPIMLAELREKNTITVFGQGERVSNFIRVDKLLNVIDIFLTKDLRGIYNIGNESLSYLDLAKKLLNEYGNKESKIIREKKGSRAKFYLDTSKIDKKMNEFTSGKVNL